MSTFHVRDSAVCERRGDEPANAVLYLTGHTVLHGSPAGQKTLVSYTGPRENLCETLA